MRSHGLNIHGNVKRMNEKGTSTRVGEKRSKGNEGANERAKVKVRPV